MNWVDDFSPLSGVLILSTLLFIVCGARLLFACEPKTLKEEEDLKALASMRTVTLIIATASFISLYFTSWVKPDVYFLFWLNYALLTTFLILWNTGRRMFNILLCFIELISCLLQLTFFVLYSEGAYKPDPHGYLYMDITFILNVLQMLLLIGGFIVQKSINIRYANRFFDSGYRFGNNFRFLHSVIQSGFIRYKVEERSQKHRSQNIEIAR